MSLDFSYRVLTAEDVALLEWVASSPVDDLDYSTLYVED